MGGDPWRGVRYETTTFGVSGLVRERPGRAAIVNGRAEVRAFF